MSQNFDELFDFDSPLQYLTNNQILAPQQSQPPFQQSIINAQVMDEVQLEFPTVKRKYQERFWTKQESIISQSPFIQENKPIKDLKQNQNLVKSQKQIIRTQNQSIRRMQQQNRFLKKKIDNLTFRLQETQIQLNKLKYNGNNNSANFQSTKQSYLRQLAEMLNKKQGGSESICQIVKKLKNMTDFDGKLKVDLINYFMSQVLQNIINDSTFYFIDSIMSRKGLWRNKQLLKIRKVDQQFIQAMGLLQAENQDRFVKDLKESLQKPAKKYKQLWKAFYKSYISLLNQGFVLQSFLRHACLKVIGYMPRQNFVKVQLLFQKIKLRKDIRQLRQSWFKQFQYQQQNPKQTDQFNSSKKTKY